MLAGDRRAIGRAISLAEDGDAAARPLLVRLWPHRGRAAVVGLTGPPGVGKSTLAAALVGHVRSLGLTVGIVAVDPSSPFTDGALLGDRVRMVDHFLDRGVFIRSMSARGHLGGVAEATFLALAVLDAAGYDVLICETVGVGQSEVEIASLVDTVVLTLQPGSGDSLQAIKAGLMEIPDVVCLNKRDHPAASAMRVELRQALALSADPPAIVETDARAKEGLDDLWQAVEDHRARLGPAGLHARRRASLARELRSIAIARAARRIDGALAHEAGLADDPDPLGAVERLLDEAFRPG